MMQRSNITPQSIDLHVVNASISLGIKGTHAADWLTQQQISIPEKPNHWVNHANQYMVLRIGLDEFLLQTITRETNAQPDKDFLALEKSLAKKLLEYAGVYQVPRADSCLQLHGEDVPHLLTQLCHLDISQVLQQQALAITQLAGVRTILLHDATQPHNYYIWFDQSYEAYMVETITYFQQITLSQKSVNTRSAVA